MVRRFWDAGGMAGQQHEYDPAQLNGPYGGVRDGATSQEASQVAYFMRRIAELEKRVAELERASHNTGQGQ
jgi:hypothetical protein